MPARQVQDGHSHSEQAMYSDFEDYGTLVTIRLLTDTVWDTVSVPVKSSVFGVPKLGFGTPKPSAPGRNSLKRISTKCTRPVLSRIRR